MSQRLRKVSRERGLSLIEVMVSTTLLAVLLSLAAPSFSKMTSSTRISAQAAEFANSLHLARAEAVRRGTPAAVRSASGSADFSDGWVVFPDANGDGVQASGTDTKDGLPVLVQPATQGVKIQRVTRSDTFGVVTYAAVSGSVTDRMFVVFNSRGVNASGPSYFRACNATGSSPMGRIVEVSASGRVSVSTKEIPC